MNKTQIKILDGREVHFVLFFDKDEINNTSIALMK